MFTLSFSLFFISINLYDPDFIKDAKHKPLFFFLSLLLLYFFDYVPNPNEVSNLPTIVLFNLLSFTASLFFLQPLLKLRTFIYGVR